jgi:hypothetical protein
VIWKVVDAVKVGLFSGFYGKIKYNVGNFIELALWKGTAA